MFMSVFVQDLKEKSSFLSRLERNVKFLFMT